MNAKTSLKCKSGEIITGHINPEIVKVVSDQEVFDCPDLHSTQEEANTRMILQALHVDKRLKELGKQGRLNDLEHLCMGSHFGTTLSFSRLYGIFYVIPVKYICYCMCFCKA
jgi:hypothetical protein